MYKDRQDKTGKQAGWHTHLLAHTHSLAHAHGQACAHINVVKKMILSYWLLPTLVKFFLSFFLLF